MTVTFHGSEDSLTVTNFDASGAGDRDVSSWVDNSSDAFHTAIIELLCDTGGTAPSAGAHWEIWLDGSSDGGSTGSDFEGMKLLRVIAAPTVANTQRRVMIKATELPRNWRLVKVNRTGTTDGTFACAFRGQNPS